jgi:hypothetical protein
MNRRCPRSAKKFFIYGISIIMLWVMTIIPVYRNVHAQISTDYQYTFVSPRQAHVGGYVYIQGEHLPPNTTHYVYYMYKGEYFNGPCPDATITTDSNGKWSILRGPLTEQEIGPWQIGIWKTGNCTGFANYIFQYFTVYPREMKLEADNAEVEANETVNLTLTGADPNKPVKMTTWKNGVQIESVTVGTTDDAGSFTQQLGPYSIADAGIYQKMAQVDLRTDLTGYKVLDRPKFSLTLSDRTLDTFASTGLNITGALANSPVNVRVTRNGIRGPETVYGNTDGNGNFSYNLGPFDAANEGHYIVEASVGDQTVTDQFIVNQPPSTIPQFPNMVYSFTQMQFDSASGRYYNDAQFHVGSTSPVFEPIMDASARTWFSDSAGNEPVGLDIGNFSVFNGAKTSGNMCSTQIPPSQECKDCAVIKASECTSDQWVKALEKTAVNGAGVAACVVLFKLVHWIAIIAGVICMAFWLIKNYVDQRDNYIKYKKCICDIPTTCSMPGRDCSKMFDGVKDMQPFCNTPVPIFPIP